MPRGDKKLAEQVRQIKTEFDLGGYFSDRKHTERAEALLDDLADQLRQCRARLAEMEKR